MTEEFRWTEENVQTVLRMREEKQTYSQIASHFGITQGMLSGFLSRYNKGEAGIHDDSKFQWTTENMTEAEKLWKAGSKEKEVCNQLGCSVSSFRRIRVAFRERFPKAQVDRYRRGAQEQMRAGKKPKPASINVKEIFKDTDSILGNGNQFRIDGVNPQKFFELKPRQCKFILSDAQEVNNSEVPCCAAKTNGSSYCAIHSALIYVKPVYSIGRA